MQERPADLATDPNWPKLLSLSAHEFRSPLTVVAGYVRMLLKDRAGPLGDDQRRLLEEAEKSCRRLSQVLAELSELSQLEEGTAPFNRNRVNLTSILTDAIAALPELPDRAVRVSLSLVAKGDLTVDGDAVRLTTALSSILHALRRELVTSDELVVHVDRRVEDDVASLLILIGEPERIDLLRHSRPPVLAPFDEWRGGNGLSLPNARRIIEAHGGRLWGAQAGHADGKASAILVLPSVN